MSLFINMSKCRNACTCADSEMVPNYPHVLLFMSLYTPLCGQDLWLVLTNKCAQQLMGSHFCDCVTWGCHFHPAWTPLLWGASCYTVSYVMDNSTFTISDMSRDSSQ